MFLILVSRNVRGHADLVYLSNVQTNCHSTCSFFFEKCVHWKSNIDTKNDGWEDASPFKNDYFGYLC